jgi:CPA2 family monovalent cation:H+ antiporter-2
MTLLVAGVAETVGISAAVGAFLVGLMLSGAAAERAHTLMGPLRDLFAAIFFAFFGLSIDPGTLWAVIGVAVGLAAVTAGTKVVTGHWAASRAGIGDHGRWRAGTVLITRGEFSIAIAGIGAVGGVEPDLAPLAGAYVLTLAVTGPLLARSAEPVLRRLQR